MTQSPMATQSKRYLENLQYARDPRVKAFLDTIADAEGTGARYDMRVGGGAYDVNKPHPGNSLTIKSNGQDINSSASGRFQFMAKTWDGLAKTMPELKGSMSPENQLAGAVELIRGRGALDAVLKGDLATAAHKVRQEWASMPSSEYGQPRRSAQYIADAYNRHAASYGLKDNPVSAAQFTAGLSAFNPKKGVQTAGGAYKANPAATAGASSTADVGDALAKAERANAGNGIDGLRIQPGVDVVSVGALYEVQRAMDAGLTPMGAERTTSILDQLRQTPPAEPTSTATMTDVEGRDVLAGLQSAPDDELARQQDTTLAYLLGQQKTEQPNFEIPSAVDRYLEQKLTTS